VAVVTWPVVVVAVVAVLLAVVLVVQRMVRTARARRIVASHPAAQAYTAEGCVFGAPPTALLPPVGDVDLEELWMEIRFACTLHRIGQDVTEGAPKEWVP
jgi:hypothetical protein